MKKIIYLIMLLTFTIAVNANNHDDFQTRRQSLGKGHLFKVFDQKMSRRA